MKKRVLSLLLALALCLGLMPTAVLAEGEEVAELNGERYASLEDAINDAAEGDVITLLSDAPADDCYTYEPLTIEMAGHKIIGKLLPCADLALNGGVIEGALWVQMDDIQVTLDAPADAQAAVLGNLTVSQGALTIRGAKVGVQGTMQLDSAEETVISGSEKAVALDQAPVGSEISHVFGAADLDGEATELAAFDAAAGTYLVSGAVAKKITTSGTLPPAPSEPVLTVSPLAAAIYPGGTAEFTVHYDGTETLEARLQKNANDHEIEADLRAAGAQTWTVSVTTTEAVAPAKYKLIVAAGSDSVIAEVTVKRCVATVESGGAVSMADSLADAFAMAASGAVITLLTDAEYPGGTLSGKAVTLNLQDNTVTAAGDLTLATGGELALKGRGSFGGTIAVVQGALSMTDGWSGAADGISLSAGGALVISGGAVETVTMLENAQELAITDGEIGTLQLAGGVRAALSGGTFGAIRGAGAAVKVGDLLAAGHALCAGDAMIDYGSVLTDETLSSARVVLCTHAYIDEETGLCRHCSAQIAARFDGAPYASIQAAADAAADAGGGVVTLLADAWREDVVIERGTVTIDLNGKTWNADNTTEDGARVPLVVSGGDVTLKNGRIYSAGGVLARMAIRVSGGAVTLGDGLYAEGAVQSASTTYPAVSVESAEAKLTIEPGAVLRYGLRMPEGMTISQALSSGAAFVRYDAAAQAPTSEYVEDQVRERLDDIAVAAHAHSFALMLEASGTDGVCAGCGRLFSALRADFDAETGTYTVVQAYHTLADALRDLQPGQHIRMCMDASIDEEMRVTAGGVLELSRRTLTLAADLTLDAPGGVFRLFSPSGAKIEGGGTLRAVAGKLDIELRDGATVDVPISAESRDAAELCAISCSQAQFLQQITLGLCSGATFSGGTYARVSVEAVPAEVESRVVFTSQAWVSNLNISGNRVQLLDSVVYHVLLLDGYLEVNGSFPSDTSFSVGGGELNVSGGRYNGGFEVLNMSGRVNFTGGEFTGAVSAKCVKGAVAVKGGRFADLALEKVNGALSIESGSFQKISVTGGVLANYLAEGCVFAAGDPLTVQNGYVGALEAGEITIIQNHTHRFAKNAAGIDECACGLTCAHHLDENAYCADCRTQFVAKIEAGGAVRYAQLLCDALNDAEDGAIVTLLRNTDLRGADGEDAVVCIHSNKTVTLDLNKFSVAAGGMVYIGKKAEDGGASYTDSAGKLLVRGMGVFKPYLHVFTGGTLDTTDWLSGVIEYIDLHDDAAFRNNDTGGTIGRLVLTGVGSALNISLAGGYYGSIELGAAVTKPVDMHCLLASGYMLTAGSEVKDYTSTQITADAPLREVTITMCQNPTERIDLETCTCTACGAGPFVAQVTDETGHVGYYTNMADALAMADGGVMKLLCNTTIDARTEITSGKIVLDFNGFTLEHTGGGGTVSAILIHGDADVTLYDSRTGGGMHKESNSETFGALMLQRGGKLTIRSGIYDTQASVVEGVAGTLVIEGGEFRGGVFTPKALAVTVSGGTFKEIGPGYTAGLCDNIMNKLIAPATEEVGYYFEDKDGNPILLKPTTYSQSNVTVKRCDHTRAAWDAEEKKWVCACAYSDIVARVNIDGADSFYRTFDEAFLAAGKANGTVFALAMLPEDTKIDVPGDQTLDLSGLDYAMRFNAMPTTLRISGNTKIISSGLDPISKRTTVVNLALYAVNGGNVIIPEKYDDNTPNRLELNGIYVWDDSSTEMYCNTNCVRINVHGTGHAKVTTGNFTIIVMDKSSTAELSGGRYEYVYIEEFNLDVFERDFTARLKPGFAYRKDDGSWANGNDLELNGALGYATGRQYRNVSIVQAPVVGASITGPRTAEYGTMPRYTMSAQLTETAGESPEVWYRVYRIGANGVPIPVQFTRNDNVHMVWYDVPVGDYRYQVEIRCNGYVYLSPDTIDASITPRRISEVRDASLGKVYDGSDAVTGEIVTGFGAADGGKLTLDAADYTVSNARFLEKNAGLRTAQYDVTLVNENYVFDDGTRTRTITSHDELIEQATPPAPKAAALTVFNELAAEYRQDLRAILGDLPENCEYGALQFDAPDAQLQDGYLERAWIEGDTLHVQVKENGVDTTGAIGKIEVVARPQNYTPVTLTIAVSAENKVTPVGEPALSAKEIAYGAAVGSVALSGALRDPDTQAEVAGVFRWVNADARPDAGEYFAEWEFTPNEITKYRKATGDAKLDVKKVDAQCVAPQPLSLIYNTKAQALIQPGTTQDGALRYSLDGTNWDAALPVGTAAKRYTVWYKVVGDGNHNDSAPAQVEAEILAREVLQPRIEVAPGSVYDGGAKTPAVTVWDGEDLIPADEYRVEYDHNIEVGTATARIVDADGGNYTVRGSAAFAIAQGSYSGKRDAEAAAKYGEPGEGDVSACIVPGGTAVILGVQDADGVLDGAPELAGAVLKFRMKDADANVGKTAQVTLKVSSKNWADYPVTVTLTVLKKAAQDIQAADLRAMYGDSGLRVAPVGVHGAVTYRVVGDPVVRVDEGGNVTILKAGETEIEIAAAGDADYAAGKKRVAVSIARRPLNVRAEDASMTVGDELPVFTVVYDGFVLGDTAETVLAPGAAATVATNGREIGTFDITPAAPVFLPGMEECYETGVLTAGTLTVRTAPSGGSHGYQPSYPVHTPDETENGTVTTEPKSAKSGDTVTVIVKPDDGYVLDDLVVTDKDGKRLDAKDAGDGKYSFVMPAGRVSIRARFAAQEEVSPFDDVAIGAYYYEAVKWAAKNGIAGGIGNRLFAPDATCTRAQIVTFLWRAAGSPEPKGGAAFADVAESAYYAKAVAWAAERGIAGGVGNGRFAPDAPCTRAQIVTLLYRANVEK